MRMEEEVANKPVTLVTLSSEVDAGLLRSALHENDIDCWIYNEHMSHLYVGSAFGLVDVEIKVLEEDLEKAQEILRDLNLSGGGSPPNEKLEGSDVPDFPEANVAEEAELEQRVKRRQDLHYILFVALIALIGGVMLLGVVLVIL